MNKSQARKETILAIASKSNLAKKLEAASAADPGIKKAFSSVTVAEILAFKPAPKTKPVQASAKPKAAPTPKTKPAVAEAKRGRGRPPGSGNAPPLAESDVLAAVAAVIKIGPVDLRDGTRWVRATAIAGRLGVTTAATRKSLGALVKAGKLRSTGKAAGTRYALAG